MLSINHVLSVANASVKNLAKVIVILERSEESRKNVKLSFREILRSLRSASWLITVLFLKHFWKFVVDYP